MLLKHFQVKLKLINIEEPLSIDKGSSYFYNGYMKIQQTRNTLSKTYLDAMRIRQAVFVKGQGVPKNMEIDAFEAHCIHFVLYDQHNYAIATCRLLPNKDYSQVSLQRMAVLEAYQRQGLGKKLLKNVLDFCQQ